MRWLYPIGLVFVCCTAGGQTVKERQEADAWQRRADQAQAAKSYLQAVQCLSRVIALDPGRQEAYLLRAQNKEHTEAWQEALPDYNIYLEWQPAHFEALWLRAMLLFRLKNWAAAKADLLKLLLLPPGETSHVVYELNPFDNTVQRAFTTQQGSSAQVFNALGMVCFETAEYPQALAYLDSALVLQPHYPEALANRGLVWEQLGSTDAARADLLLALQLNPDLEVARHNLAITHRQTPTEEEAHLNQLIGQNPAIPFPFYERATMRIEQQRYTAALADINEALRIDSLNETYWVTRGIIHEKLRQWRTALRDYSRAIQINESWPDAWFHHGNAARRLNDRATAIEDYTMAIFLRADYGNAYYNRAIMNYETGDYAAACADLRQAKESGVPIDLRLQQKVCAK